MLEPECRGVMSIEDHKDNSANNAYPTQVMLQRPTGDCDDAVKQKIAAKIINLARAGERNPDLLCERALKDIRGSQP